jgi:hypothetical protein
MKWEDGVFIRTDAPVPTGVLGSIKQQRAERVFLELLARITAQGRYVSDAANSPQYAPKIFAGDPQRHGVAKREFVAAMNNLFAQQKIRVEPYLRTAGRIVKVET